MNNKFTDIFETTKKENITYQQDKNSNFFLEDMTLQQPIRISSQESSRRLNDYDFNLLKEDAYKDVTDDLFKLEYKIAKTEEEINNFDSQIQAAKDIGDTNLINELNYRRNLAIEDYDSLIAMYNNKSLSARLTDNLSNIFGKNLRKSFTNFKQKATETTDIIFSKLPGPFSAFVELKKSLSKLENINKSVDELMTRNVPFGENIDKYNQLSKYIIKANSIQSEISRFIKK
ncbi:MAG: hypothetical protein E7Z89_01355 [Cyanobacteria bacterium SIG28]|nr:hypothetical protein [Cyanobacteria bacterium SIG28]